MSYEIEGRLSVKILINGYEFPFSLRNTLNFLHITSCTHLGVPMIHFSVSDVVGFFNTVPALSDGASIAVTLGTPSPSLGTTVQRTYEFRLNSFKKSPSAGRDDYEVDGYLDCSTYWLSSTKNPIKATAAKAIALIADQCNLRFDGVSTADSQTWWPRNRTFHQWARDIACHAYRDPNSCLQFGLELDKTLILRDVNANDPVSKDISLATPKQGFLLAADFAPRTLSGSLNNLTGYALHKVRQDSSQSNPHEILTSINVTKRAQEGSLLVSKNLHQNTTQSAVVFSPISCGNIPASYEKGYYQNQRFSNLFSSSMEVLLAEVSDVRLLTVVNLHLDAPEGTRVELYAGLYRVVSRTIYIQGTTYYEKLGLVRRSLSTALPDNY